MNSPYVLLSYWRMPDKIISLTYIISFMEKFAFYQDKVSASLKKLKYTKPPLELYEPIDYILSVGGKRIRPSLVLIAYHMFDEHVDYALNAALAVEVFHNFTLLHDDIMDKAELRRNKPTVHKKWNESVAILSGDAMMIESYQLLFSYPADTLTKIIDVFNITALQVCEGQQYDMNFQRSSSVSVNDYLMMIELKTSVLIATALKIGALLADVDIDTADNLYNFGKNIGIAFQLQDDLLDVYADQDSFGKSIGGDIVENKKTYLLLQLVNKASEKDKNDIDEWLKKGDFDPVEKINVIKSYYDKYNIKTITKEKIKQYFDAGMNQLDRLSVKADKKSTLQEFTDMLFNRMY
jgi:geranylgeranyl diphosphate synthase type II